MVATPTLDKAVAAQLSSILGARFTTAKAVRSHHAHGEGWDRPVLPGGVCFPETNEEVAAIVGACAQYRTPLVPFGAGSSLEGHVVPPESGVSVDMTGMNRILEVSQEDLDCRVQAGVTREQLDAHLQPQGVFFPVDPGADATLGGMTATGASGTTTVRYGAMRENVLGLTVVLANGAIIQTGGKARKSSAGYDLTRLLIGSEGTLGIITEVQLRLCGIPETISAAVCQFDRIGDAVDTVIEAIQIGVDLARSELVDELMMKGFALHSGLDEYAHQPTLFLEFHGTPGSVDEQVRLVAEICQHHGGSEVRHASRTEDRSRLWKVRHDAYYAGIALAPGKRSMITDACVPLSRLTECIEATQADIAEHALLAPIVGHIGDGNFHCQVMCDPDDESDVAAAESFVTRLAQRAIDMGGTCTGEHGVGSGKIDLLEREHGAGIEVMRAIKQALDPLNLMNPGKVLRAAP
ncbi:MAG TPA: FAD-linked oxidase C-terminal domain-containing protein [Acidobacteriota bacterium]|nr:FAD-linked oxidase C-terminal domain-containing protein [Acidobacteriota bacterium]